MMCPSPAQKDRGDWMEKSNDVVGEEVDDIEQHISDDERDTGNRCGDVIVEAVPTTKIEHDATIHDGMFSQQARFVARKPWLCVGVAFVVATVLSVIGLIVGDFQVAADNAGWRTRGTLIANRHQQVTLVLFNRARLFSEGEAAWEDLTNNVQSSWESDDDEEERLLATSKASESTFTVGNISPQSRLFVLTNSTKRRLQEGLFTGGLQGCDVSW